MIKYLLMFSMVTSALSGAIFTSGTFTVADELPRTKEIIVTSERAERFLDITAAQTTVLTRDDITTLQISTISELLETISDINLVERGTPGSQVDITIRGSSVEGVLLLINGIRVHDPQTGHFTMDIPVDLSSVERVEVMAGGGSSLYGSSASGGVINIVTNKTPSKVHGNLGLGSFGTGKAAATFSGEKDGTAVSLSFHGGRSDGYKSGADLQHSGVNVDGMYTSSSSVVNWNVGFLSKRFGAEGFYAPYKSFEKTETLQGGINAGYVFNDNNMVRFRFGGRGHGDDFVLIRNKPEFYSNTHYNRSYSLAGEYLTCFHDYLSIVMGAETERLGITSPGLGNHSDYNRAVYGELSSKTQKSSISLSMRYDNNSRKESIISPGLGIVVSLGENKRFRFRAEKSFRSPTYTELHYKSPANRGDPLLKSQHSQSIEAGVDITQNNNSAGFTGFARKSTNVIDWVRYPDEEIWSSANHGRLLTTGIEMKFNFSVWQSLNIRINSSILKQKVSKKRGIESKYILNPVEKTAVAVFSGPLFIGLNGVFSVRYEEMLSGLSRSPVTFKISKKLKKVKLIFSISNLLNEWYEELPGLRAPGRWFDLGLQWSVGGGQ